MTAILIGIPLAGAALYVAWRVFWPRYLLWRIKRLPDDTDEGAA